MTFLFRRRRTARWNSLPNAARAKVGLALLLLVATPVSDGLRADEPGTPPAVRTEQGPGKATKKDTKDGARKLFDGRTLGKWKVADKFDFEHHGEVTAEKGDLVMKKGSPATGIYFSGDVPRNHYELRLQAKRVEGSDFFCGLTFPFNDSYCTWVLGGWGGGVVGLSNIDNMSAVENATTDYVDFKQDQWYAIRLRVTPDRIQGWIDDKQYFDVETEGHKFSIWWEQEPMRPLGIASWNTTAAIRNVELRILKKTDEPQVPASEKP